ncbi:glycosyltransferase family 2 protein [Leptolyngbya sp. O-77]|uniref:glycosyltransferase family 2 protein n=1 Tax=Leptolyngbya sp. O-77 TaxID=1080068 RepID=UPI00074D4C1A|nr:glycosyltransferase family 2 protein [Leptolyngbya sp. O-77]BAU40889.1 hypothetical protein O77CONTIG1_00696 [Leptolyngbya sp. O-77]
MVQKLNEFEALPQISIVIPMYDEEPNIDHLFERLFAVMSNIKADFEIICVNDGSSDRTLALLLKYHNLHPEIKVVDLSRNFGKEIALTAGIDYAVGQAVIPLDADLQDPPELIAELISRWQEGYDVVYAVRRSRQGESWLKRFTSKVFYKCIRQVSSTSIPADTGDFRLLDRCVVEALKQLPERTRFMKGLFAWVGYRQTHIYFDRPERYGGQTSWNYWHLWNLAIEGIASFSTAPLKIWIYVGSVIAALAFLYATFLILRTLIFGIDIAGYASLMVVILFLGGIQLLTLGVLGEYLGRVYEEVKGRPLYLVREQYGFPTSSARREQKSAIDPPIQSERF